MGEPDHDGLLRRLDHMVEKGRVTEAEAAALRAAQSPSEVEAAICAIRLRHAAPKLAQAVDDGTLSEEDASSLRERLRNGEHSRTLRAHLRRGRREGSDH
jgi:hypothetical protein